MLQSVNSVVLHAGVAIVVSSLALTGAARPIDSHSARPAARVAQATLRLTVAPTGNEARFRVTEQLVGFDLPNDAIGKTNRVSGSLVVQPNGQIVAAESKFEVMVDSLVTDQSMRDNYVRRNTLQVAQFPKAVFVPKSATGLPARLPAAAELTFQLIGDLTIRDVTKPATWQVKGKMLPSGEFTGTASTKFAFADFNITKPQVRRVLSVADSIGLEYDFHLVPSGAPSAR